MELWKKGRSFAEETAKRSQDLSFNNDVDINPNFESFGITDELREFVKGITVTTFRDFPLQGFFLFCVFIIEED